MESSESNTDDDQPCVILRLPNELLLEIIQYLDGCSVVAFSQSCKQLSTTCHGIRYLNFDNSGGQSLGKSLPQLNSFFKRSVNPSLLAICNFTGCYWIPLSILKPFLTRCVNLEGLYLTDTSLTIEQIAVHILPKCTQLASLSFSLRHGDWNSCLLDVPNLQEVLKRLTSVEMILAQDCTIFEAVDFLKYCENLENLMAIRAHGRLESLPREYLRRTLSFPKLKSLLFIVDPTSLDCYQFYNPKSTCELSEIWSNFLDIDCHHGYKHHHKFKSLCWDLPGRFRRPFNPLNVAGISHLTPQNFSSIENVWEPRPLQRNSIAPKLKLCNCFYDNQSFEEFATNHPLIEVLKLRAFSQIIGKASPDSWNPESWKNFAKLRILSIEPVIIEGHGNQISKKRKLDVNGQPVEILPFMAAVLRSCPLIQEIELASFNSHQIKLSLEELSAISQCVNLKKLTLSNFSMPDGRFLEQILKKCTHLESFRLKDLGPTALCNYAVNLCAALPSAQNLKTFCLFQRNVPLIPKLLQSLESCGSLSRLSLVCPSKSAAWNKKLRANEFAAEFNQFCTKLNHLVAVFCVLSVPKTHCHAANTLLKEKMKEIRPSFRADIQSCGNGNWMQSIDSCQSKVLPLVHSEIMTRFQSQVANIPSNYKSLLFH